MFLVIIRLVIFRHVPSKYKLVNTIEYAWCVFQAIRLNHKKEPVIILNNEDNMLLDDKMIYTSSPKIYPFAMVLRLRVLQVGCNV